MRVALPCSSPYVRPHALHSYALVPLQEPLIARLNGKKITLLQRIGGCAALAAPPGPSSLAALSGPSCGFGLNNQERGG